MMARWLIAGVITTLVAATSLASADAIVPPAGWKIDTDKAAAQADRVRRLAHFGGLPTEFSASVFVPATPGVVLYVTRLSTKQNSPSALRAAIDDFELPTRETGVQVGDSTKKVDEPNKLVVASIGVRDTSAQLQTQSSFVAAADAAHLVVITGDCIATDDVDAKLLDACKQALATLDPDIKPADRVAVSLPPTADQLPPIDRTSPTPSGLDGSATVSQPSKMGDGSRMVMPPMVVPQDTQTDRRPIYIGAGILLLAVVFWWNRRRRESFERADRGDADDDRDANKPAARRSSRDDDGDDLHAAAVGDDDEAAGGAQTISKPSKKANADD